MNVIKNKVSGGLPVKAITGACLLMMASPGFSTPHMSQQQWAVEENTATGTVLGKVTAAGGGATSQLQLEVGSMQTKQWLTNDGSFESIAFTRPFAAAPALVSQVQSKGDYWFSYYKDVYNFSGWVFEQGYEMLMLPRHHNVSSNGFEAILETGRHKGSSSVIEKFGSVGGKETIGWLAVSADEQGIWSGLPFEVINTGEKIEQGRTNVYFSGPFDDAPNVFGSITTTNEGDRTRLGVHHIKDFNTRIYMDEIDDGDHGVEAVSLMMLQGSGNLYDSDGRLIGEVGAVAIKDRDRDRAYSVGLSNQFTNPVVFIQSVGVDENVSDAAFRFTDITGNGFSGYLHGEKESVAPSYFGSVELQYLVLEAGSWNIDLHNYQYQITHGNDSGAFNIDSQTGEISVAKSSELDYESGVTQFVLTVKVTDGTGQSSTTTITIDVDNVADSLNTDAQAINGLNKEDWFGYGATAAGDVNGDGFDDVIIGAPQHDSNGSDSGAAYVLFGNASGILADLKSVASGYGGFVIKGESAGDKAGFAVAGNADINGDGLDDVVVGAPYASPLGDESGKVYVVFGKTDSNAVELSDIAEDNNPGGFVMTGHGSWDHVGGSLVLGDFNADGLADISIGEVSRSDTEAAFGLGSIRNWVSNLHYTVFGKTDGQSIALGDLADESQTQGFAIVESGRRVNIRHYFGAQTLPVGDFNSDGWDDVIFNMGVNDEPGGESYVLSGRSDLTAISKTDAEAMSIKITPEAANYSLDWDARSINSLPGFITAPAGDINGDGIADIAMLSPDSNCCESHSNPRAYVIFGQNEGLDSVDLAQIAQGNGGFIIENDFSNVTFSSWIAVFGAIGGAGDVNGDGFDDLLIGDQYADNGNGRYFLVYGKTSQTPVYLSDIALGNGGFSSAGNPADALGHWVGTAGDINGDGIADMLMAAPMASPEGQTNVGTVYVMLGKGDEITHWGGTANDVVSLGGDVANKVAAGEGDDRIVKSANDDVIFAGPGNDEITLLDNNIRRIDGGQGYDALVLSGQNIVLDLASRGDAVRSIELIDIRGSGANQLAFNKNISSNGSVTVKGDADDIVYSTNQNWNEAGTTVIDGVTYQVYTAGDAELHLQLGVAFEVNASPAIAAQSFTIDEYTQGGAPVGTVIADSGDAGDSVTFAIVGGNDDGFFAIDSISGELALSEAVGRIDYESAPSYALTVEVTDQFAVTAQAVVTVNINNLSGVSHTYTLDASGSSGIWGHDTALASILGEGFQHGIGSTINFSGERFDSPLMEVEAGGTFGYIVSYSFDGGKVEATLPVELTVSYPDEVQPGSPFELTTTFSYGEGAGFEVTSPSFDVDATLMLEDFYYDFDVNLDGLGSYKDRVSEAEEIEQYEGERSGTTESYSFNVGSEAYIARGERDANNPLKFEAHISDDKWLDKQLTYPSNWAMWPLTRPFTVDKCKDDGFAPLGEDMLFRMEFALMETYLWLTTRLEQNFTLELNPVATLVFEDGSEITFDPQDNVQITPELSHDANGDGIVDASLRIQLRSTFTNDSDIINYVRAPFKSSYLNYNIQEAHCGQTGITLFGSNGIYYKKASMGPLIDTEIQVDLAIADGQTDLVEDVYSFELNEVIYTEKLSFDLCDGEGTACAASIEPVNTAPMADNSTIAGLVSVGRTVTGTYIYNDGEEDMESGSGYQWYRATDLSGSNASAITEATAVDYTVTSGDTGQYLKFCVTPSDGDEHGVESCSPWHVVSTFGADAEAGFGRAVYFNAEDKQYARIAMSGGFNPVETDFSIETWVKFTKLDGTDSHIVQQLDDGGTGRTFIGLRGDSGQFFTDVGAAALNASSTAVLDTWYHVAVTFEQDSSLLALYVNGELENSVRLAFNAGYGDLVLGVNKSLDGNYLTGALDETRIWTTARSAEQIKANMHLAVAVDAPDLLAYYNYNADDGYTLNDETGKFFGSYYNNPSFVQGSNKVLSLDGKGDYAQVEDHNNLDFGKDSFTVETWVFGSTELKSDYHDILSKKKGDGKNKGFVLRLKKIDGNLYPNWVIADDKRKKVATANTVFVKNQWNHIAAVVDRDSQTTTLYVNGEAVDSALTGSVGSVTNAKSLRLGRGSSNSSNTGYFNGYIDEVRIWKAALSAEQLQGRMYGGVSAASDHLVAYYSFESGDAIDISGNGHDAELREDSTIVDNGLSISVTGSGDISGVLPAVGNVTYATDEQPAHGTVSVDSTTGAFIYIPNDAGQSVVDSFSYVVINADGEYGFSKTVTVSVIAQ